MLTAEKIQKALVEAPQAAKTVIAEMKAGSRDTGLEWGPAIINGEATVKEMIGTDDGASDFLEKTTYDVYQGREAVELVYKTIYSTREDANFPRLIRAKEYGPVQVVFLEKFEGGEVRFGSLAPGVEKVVEFKTYAAGLEWSEDMVEYNEFWSLTDAGLAFGEAYNKLLNHLHLGPIVTGTYVTTGGGIAAQKAKQEDPDTPAAQLVAFDTDVKTTLQNAFDVLPLADYALINSGDSDYLEREVAKDLLDDDSQGPVRRRWDRISKVIYDGSTVDVDERTYTYDGVDAGFVYLLVAKRQFTEYIKHDLRLDSDDGDLSRLIVSQLVGRARRAVFAGLTGKYGVIKVDIRS